MGRKELMIKNGIVGLVGQISAQFLQFFLRKYILRYIGLEILGISSTLSSVILTLSLAELGFQQAIVFYLYDPLGNRDKQKINTILTVLKRVYEGIGIIFIVAIITITPFLKYILKGVIIDKSVCSIYALLGINAAMTYFLAYKRALLYADQKGYISQCIDSLVNVLICIIKFVIVCCFKNYMLYLIAQVIQTIISNAIIHRYCIYHYPYLCVKKFDWSIFRRIVNDVKSIFISQIAGYVYNATDNLIISGFVGTIYVGYLSNYTIFTIALKQTVNSIFNSMTPIIGNMLSENTNIDERESDFRLYAYIRYLLATIIIIPWVLLANNLIQIFFGNQYTVDNSIVILLAVDLYIHIVYSMCCEYINGGGLFRLDKRISIIGAVTNIMASIVFVQYLGVSGVLLGTVISQIVFWLGRSIIVYRKVFNIRNKKYIEYIVENLLWIISAVFSILLSTYIDNMFEHNNLVVSSIRMLFICEMINFIVQLIVLMFSYRRKRLIKIIKSCLKII